MRQLGIPLSKGLVTALISTCISCSSIKQTAPIEVDLCVISAIGGSVVCRCVKPDESLYSLPIEECAEKKYNALSPDDAAKLYGRLFQLEHDLNSCKEEK